MPVMQNFELASRSVPNKSYGARRKPRPLIEVLRYIALEPFVADSVVFEAVGALLGPHTHKSCLYHSVRSFLDVHSLGPHV